MVNFLLLTSIVSLVTTTLAASKAFYGLNYGVNINACPTLETVKRDFRILSQYTNIVRIYSVKDCNLGELALQASQANKLRLYLGMWIDKTDSFDRELDALQNIATSNSFYNVEAVIVGSEVMYRDDMKPKELAARIEKIKTVVHPLGTKVTTSEVYYKFTPEVIDAVDFLMMNAFIYWEGEHVDNAANTLLNHYDYVKSISNGKKTRISETGWPNNGYKNIDSEPSPDNQREFLLEALCQTRQKGIEMIWFSAIDEEYKAGVEGHFGLLDFNRQLKSQFQYEKLMNPCQPQYPHTSIIHNHGI